MAARRTTRTPTKTAHEPYGTRGWLVVAGGVATGAIVLAAWLPVGALLSQRAQLATASAHLSQLSTDGRVLQADAKLLSTPEVASQLAREQYQLVAPGQRLIQVLTPTGVPASKATGGPFPGDPGLSAPVDPGVAAVGPTPASAPAHEAAVRAGAAGGFLSRVVATLEFWR